MATDAYAVDVEDVIKRFGKQTALDGVSLTVNEVSATRFGVNIIPHTLACTNFGSAKAGQRMNLEIDLIARYVARLLGARAEGAP